MKRRPSRTNTFTTTISSKGQMIQPVPRPRQLGRSHLLDLETGRRNPSADSRENAARLPLLILPADRERVIGAAELKARHGLGYADSFAAALALEHSATLVTVDAEFAKLGRLASTSQRPSLEPSAP
jgi:predicted nucleic acid-binding protein